MSLREIKRQHRAVIWLAVRQGMGLIGRDIHDMIQSVLEWMPEIWWAVKFTVHALAEWVRAWF